MLNTIVCGFAKERGVLSCAGCVYHDKCMILSKFLKLDVVPRSTYACKSRDNKPVVIMIYGGNND